MSNYLLQFISEPIKKIFFLFFWLMVCSYYVYGQNKKSVDSLMTLYKQAKSDTSKITIIHKIINLYQDKPDTIIVLANQTLALSEKLNYKKGQGYSLSYLAESYYSKSNYKLALEYYQKSIPFIDDIKDYTLLSRMTANIGVIYDIQGYYLSALEYYQKSLSFSEKINNKNHIANTLANIGNVYKNLGNYPIAMEYYFKGLKLFEELKSKKNIAYIFNNIGIVYFNQDNILLAQEYFTKSLKIREEIDDKKGQASCFNNIGNIYLQERNLTGALDYYNKSLKIYEQTNDKRGQAISLNNIGDIHHKLQNNENSAQSYQKALLLNEEIKNKWGATYSLLGLARTEASKKNYDKGIEYAERSLQLAIEIKALAEIKNAHNNLFTLYKHKEDYKKALEYNEYFVAMKDSIFNEKNTKIIANLESKIALEKKEKEIEILNKNQEILKKDAQLQNIEAQRQKNARLAIEKQAEIEKYVMLASAEKNKHKADSLKTIAQTKQLELDKYVAVEQKLQAENKARKLELLKEQDTKLFQQYIIYLILAGFFSMILFAYFIFRSKEKEKKAKEMMTKQREEIYLQAQQLTEVNATKDKLFAIIGHDLRGPIGSVKSVLSLMLDNLINKEDFDNISERLLESVENVYTMLNNLLFWADAQMQGIETKPTTINLYELATKNFDLFAEKAENKHIFLKNKLPNSLIIWADLEQINLVFRNLIANALKFTGSNGEILISYEIKENHVQINIKDTGIGMNAETLQKIFKKNLHFTTKGTKGEKGTGLGLLLCQEMIEKNGGQIWVESEIEKGSIFKFTLPLHKNYTIV